MLSMNRSTLYTELVSGSLFGENTDRGTLGFGCIEALVNAGTANLIVNGYVRGGF